MNQQQAIQLVEQHLNRHQPKEYRLHVIPGATRNEDDWWYVCVGPDRDNIRRYDYYDVLAQISREIEDEDDVNITLLPPPSGAA
ncbi:hypothetical protein HED60_24250 [Planctomycetales bacterium ZRK34]|nr:hypothetical protein HED60_24250 [Planctomycetales bacterium ZRK34]